MAFRPRSAREILRSMAARVVARSPLNDLAEGSVILTVLYSIAEAIGATEIRLARIRDSFFLQQVAGADLDERVAELPPTGLERLPASYATGTLRLTRGGDISGALAVTPGSSFGRVDDTTVTYEAIFGGAFAPASPTVEIQVRASVVGTAGNAPAGVVTKILSASDEIIGVTNPSAILNGQDEETDDQLRRRAQAYLSSLAKCQPLALEHAALSFRSSLNTRVSFARIFEDPARPGYSELVIDDGSGLIGSKRAGQASSGTVPAGGQAILWHEAPAVAPIAVITVVRPGPLIFTLRADDDDFISVPERGLVHILKEDLLQEDDTWTIAGYEVYTGLLAELQQVIEGDNSDPFGQPGHRAAGTRVRVLPPTKLVIGFDMHVVPVTGVDLDVAVDRVRDTTIAYLGTLSPGEPLYIAQLIDRIMDNDEILNVRIYRENSEPAELAQDVYPPTPRHVLRTEVLRINAIPSPEI